MQNRPTNKTQSVAANNSFVTKGDLETAFGRFRKAKEALSAAKKLSEGTEQLAESAAQAVYEQYPYIADVKSETALADERKRDFVQGIIDLLRIVEYCLIVGGTGPLDEFLPGRMEYYRVIGQSMTWYLAALRYLKKSHGLEHDEALEANLYFDHLIRSLS